MKALILTMILSLSGLSAGAYALIHVTEASVAQVNGGTMTTTPTGQPQNERLNKVLAMM